MEMENENESVSVSENENERHFKSMQQIQHAFHEEHPLVLVAEQSNIEGLKAYCDGCGELLSAPCFTCIHCNYNLHKQCAEAPLSLPNHPLHPQQSYVGFFLRQRPYPSDHKVYGCELCKEKCNMFFYQCYHLGCWFSIDIKCAKLSSSYKFNQPSKHDIHQHPLTFIESPTSTIDVPKRFNYSWCHETLIDAIYFCFDCPFIIHKKCIDELPTEIDHLTHRLHPLILNRIDSDYLCNPCQKKHSGPFYGCSLCHFNINIECAWPRSTVEDRSRHQHPFTLFWWQNSFICDACGTQGNYISYTCSTCCITLHKKCISLPRIIKFSRHDHYIFHKYFLQTRELTRQDCKICFKEVRLERGSYSYVKQGCNYVVHVNCVLENDKLYKVIEEEKQCEEFYEKSMQSSIIRVIEVNEAGEATKIEHFNEEKIDRKCDGCMLPMSNIFYYCSECPFFLQKTCVELPRIKQHWLYSSDYWVYGCALCKEKGNMFFYQCTICYFSIDIKCAKLSSSYKFNQPSKHDIHQHPLTLIESPTSTIDVPKRFNCSWCHKPLIDAIYLCLDCPLFIIHKKCLDELLTEIDHLTHRLHPLILNPSDSDYLCNLCQKQHSRPFYGCSLCHFNINVECAWPRSTVEDRSRHQHPFTLFRRQDSFICDAYCKICFEEVRLERGSYSCVKQGCNYVVHSSIIRVIEVNKAGEATKIEHFSHQHCLVLADKMEEEIDRKCDGCMLPISNIFYYCSECPFFLHKTCAELPRIKQHWFRQSNATLNFDSFNIFNFCDRHYSGFFYKIKKYWDMCLRCAKVADIIKWSDKYCNGCGNRCRRAAFKCGKCKFTLDFGCLTLPHSAFHKIDEHMLNRTYHDDKEESYCDICEQERDPSLYTVPYYYYYFRHNHALKFFRKVEGYPECSHCGKLCQEEILECEESTRNCIIHCKCRYF
ncbi:hypothetical protein V6Z12_A06G203000 [Gossypium hirsutum]